MKQSYVYYQKKKNEPKFLLEFRLKAYKNGMK